MASQNFYALERTLRRMYWIDLVDRQMQGVGAMPFRASLIVNPRSGLPLGGTTIVAGEQAARSAPVGAAA